MRRLSVLVVLAAVLMLVGAAGPPQGTLASPGGKMYWTTFMNIKRANLDGTTVEIVCAPDPIPLGLALDAASGTMYWSQGGNIWRATLNCSEA
jgi:hypothetical protein